MLQTASDAVLTDLQDRGIDRMHLCGLSLGAMIATRFAIDHPQRVASLILSGSQVHPNGLIPIEGVVAVWKSPALSSGLAIVDEVSEPVDGRVG